MDNRINQPASRRILSASKIRQEDAASNLAQPQRATQADVAQADALEASVFGSLAPAIIGKGGELVPDATGHRGALGCRDAVASPTYLTVEASATRLQLAENARVLDLTLDLNDTINARDNLERMIAGQMALFHSLAMKSGARAAQALEQAGGFDRTHADQHSIHSQRFLNTAAKASAEFQNCALALHRLRTGGKQAITVTHVQNTQVNEGGQAVVVGGGGAQPQGGLGGK